MTGAWTHQCRECRVFCADASAMGPHLGVHDYGPFRCTSCGFCGVREERITAHQRKNPGHAGHYRDLSLVARIRKEVDECELPIRNPWPGRRTPVPPATNPATAAAMRAALPVVAPAPAAVLTDVPVNPVIAIVAGPSQPHLTGASGLVAPLKATTSNKGAAQGPSAGSVNTTRATAAASSVSLPAASTRSTLRSVFIEEQSDEDDQLGDPDASIFVRKSQSTPFNHIKSNQPSFVPNVGATRARASQKRRAGDEGLFPNQFKRSKSIINSKQHDEADVGNGGEFRSAMDANFIAERTNSRDPGATPTYESKSKKKATEPEQETGTQLSSRESTEIEEKDFPKLTGIIKNVLDIAIPYVDHIRNAIIATPGRTTREKTDNDGDLVLQDMLKMISNLTSTRGGTKLKWLQNKLGVKQVFRETTEDNIDSIRKHLEWYLDVLAEGLVEHRDCLYDIDSLRRLRREVTGSW